MNADEDGDLPHAYAWAAPRTSSSTLTVFCTLQPVATCALSFVLLGVAVTPAQALASIQAVFFPADRVKWVETYARQVHRALKAARRHVPLVVYNGLIDKRGPAFTAADA